MEKYPEKILIVQTAFIGDVILTLPLVSALKKHYERCSVHFCIKPEALNILDNNPSVSGVFIYDKRNNDKGIIPLFKLAARLKKEHFDCAVIPHRSLRSALLCYTAGIPVRIGFHTSAGRFLFTDKIHYKTDIHEIGRNLSLLSALKITADNIHPEILISPEDKELVDTVFSRKKPDEIQNFITIAPGSEWDTKRWTPEGFAGLIELLWAEKKTGSLLIGSEKDMPVCEKIKNMAKSPVVNLCGQLTLRQSGEVIKRSKVLVSNDSGAVHLAVAVKQKVVIIYGPTSPEFGFYPYGEGHTIIKEDLNCSPCSIHGGKKCREKHFQCMKNITPDKVLNKVLNYL